MSKMFCVDCLAIDALKSSHIRCLHKIAKVAVKFVMSAFACMEQLASPLDEFSCNLIFGDFAKIR